ncbi:MAG TPA: mechanosensitive ion channel family protein [Longimicrobiales bacterium]|nr:mechanosensitive ion channel family protein [Longimicrobiales bacterium]
MMETTLLGNTLRVWLLAAIVAATVYAALHIVRTLVVRNLSAIAARTATDVDDIVAHALRRTKFFFLLFVSLYAGARILVLPLAAETALRVIGVLVLSVQAALWGNAVISAWLTRQVARRLEEDPASATTINALGFMARLAFYAVLVLLALANLGIQITPLLAGLGVGGIAIALALQSILGDLFASLSIVLDRPFAIGDFIIVGELMGTVEYIGLKTTRVRSLSGEQLVFANSDLLGARIRNFKRMQERRVLFSLGVTYDTPRLLLERIPAMIRDAVEAQQNVRFDRAHFREYGDFSLNFEVVYYVLQPDFNTYMDVQQAINLDIHRRFEDAGIDFAYPTQTLILTRGT